MKPLLTEAKLDEWWTMYEPFDTEHANMVKGLIEEIRWLRAWRASAELHMEREEKLLDRVRQENIQLKRTVARVERRLMPGEHDKAEYAVGDALDIIRIQMKDIP
jgi:hypothetical protein